MSQFHETMPLIGCVDCVRWKFGQSLGAYDYVHCSIRTSHIYTMVYRLPCTRTHRFASALSIHRHNARALQKFQCLCVCVVLKLNNCCLIEGIDRHCARVSFGHFAPIPWHTIAKQCHKSALSYSVRCLSSLCEYVCTVHARSLNS